MEQKKFTQIVALVDRDVSDRFRRMVKVYGLDRREVLKEIVTNALESYSQKFIKGFESNETFIKDEHG